MELEQAIKIINNIIDQVRLNKQERDAVYQAFYMIVDKAKKQDNVNDTVVDLEEMHDD